MKKLILCALIAAVMLFCFMGCSDNNGINPPPKEEGKVVAYVGTTIFDTSLDPIKGAMSYGFSFTNAALLRVGADSTYIGDMAADWTVSDDALVYTFNLKKGIKFSDGSEMTAKDVAFTYETVKNNQAHNEKVDLTRLSSAEAIDDYTVRFTLLEPYSPFIDTAAMLGIVPENSYDSAKFDRFPIGTGPWRVVQYDPNQQIIVEPNEYYYEGAPALGRVTLLYMDNDTALSAARSGRLDVVMVNPSYASEAVESMTVVALETMDIRNISLPVTPAVQKDGVMAGNDVTSDRAVREALSIGIDRKTIIDNALNGVGRPAVGFTPNLPWADTNTYEDNRKEEAIAILEGAGWTDSDGDGVREKEGIICEFDVYAPEDRYPLAAALSQDAAALGIRVNARSAGWDDISKNMASAGVVWGWGQYRPTVIDTLFNSKYAFSGDFNNTAGVVNPQVDALIGAALRERDREAAIESWKGAQALANADFPYLYIVNIEHCYFVSDRLDISVNTQIAHPHGHGTPIICNMKDWKLK